MPVLLHKKKSDFKDSFLAGGGDLRPRNRCRPNSSFFSKSVFTLLCHLSSYNYAAGVYYSTEAEKHVSPKEGSN